MAHSCGVELRALGLAPWLCRGWLDLGGGGGPGWEARTASAESWAMELSHRALLVTGSGGFEGPVPSRRTLSAEKGGLPELAAVRCVLCVLLK